MNITVDGNFPGFRIERWREVVERYEKEPDDFYNAFWYIEEHPIYLHSHESDWKQFKSGTDFVNKMIVKVDPETERIEDDPERNTATRFWFETGPVYTTRDMEERTLERYREARPEPATDTDAAPKPIFETTHDLNLNTSAPTYEEGIVQLAAKIASEYGHDRSEVGTFKGFVESDDDYDLEAKLDELDELD